MTKFSERKGNKNNTLFIENTTKKEPSVVTVKKSKSIKKTFLFTIIILLVIFAGYIWYLNFNNSGNNMFQQLFSNCSDETCLISLDPPKVKCQFPPFCSPELPKTNNRTNLLVVGIDTRENGVGNLTDTIMLISYDHISKYATFISIPRDTYVKFKNAYGNTEQSKINSVYYLTGMIKKDHEKGMLGLSKVVGDITGIQPHYTVMVTLKGFKEAIDNLGGLKINIPEDHTDAYPQSELSAQTQKNCKVVRFDGPYCVFSFKKGEQTLNGEMALVYARSREYSSDYNRALRQQLVITAVKNQILSSDTLGNPPKLFDFAQTLNNSITTSSYNLGDIIAALSESRAMAGTVNVILDPTFGSSGLISPGGASIGYINKINDDSNFTKVKAELSKIFNYPEVYNEQPRISVYLATSNKKFDKDYVKQLNALNLPKTGIIAKNTLINSTKDIKYVVEEEVSITSSTNSSSTSKTSSVNTSKNTTTVSKTIDKTIYGVYLIDYTNNTKVGTQSLLLRTFPELQQDQNITFKRRNNDDFAIIIFDKDPATISSSSTSSKTKSSN